MTQISGGKAKGIKLRTLSKSAVRPATQAVREALFSSIDLSFLAGACFLDLYAGIGSYGLEAVSRGAQSGLFVERDKRLSRCIEVNLNSVCKSIRLYPGMDPSMAPLVERFQLHVQDVFKFQPHPSQRFDFIFIDPPYSDLPEVLTPLFTRYGPYLSTTDASRIILEAPAGCPIELKDWLCEKQIGATKDATQPTLRVFKRS